MIDMHYFVVFALYRITHRVISGAVTLNTWRKIVKHLFLIIFSTVRSGFDPVSGSHLLRVGRRGPRSPLESPAERVKTALAVTEQLECELHECPPP